MFWSGKEANREFEEHLHDMIKKGGLLLDVGSGRHKLYDNFIGIDPYHVGPDVNVKAYMWDLPFETETVDGLVCISALEHVSKYQVLPTLHEFNRVLKPGARMIILVPDLFYCLKKFLENPNVFWEMDLIFGLQSQEDGTIHEGEFHKTGFTRDIFAQYISEIPSFKILNIYDVEAYQQINLGFILEKK